MASFHMSDALYTCISGKFWKFSSGASWVEPFVVLSAAIWSRRDSMLAKRVSIESSLFTVKQTRSLLIF